MEIPSHVKPYLEQVEQMMELELAGENAEVYGLLVPYLKRGGKRVRPLLSFLSCGAAGGDCQSVVKPAAIIELFHNFTLIHDDIEDDSRFRRGEPTLHITHGIAMALNSGDALYTFLLRKLAGLEMRPRRLLELQKLYLDSFKRVVDGQGIEIAWIRAGRFDIDEDGYLKMIGGKTSALMGLSCEAGAFMAGSGKRQRKALREFGELIGLAFQIHDDVLNVAGNFEKYKKEIGGDISEGKRTLLVVHCLTKASDQEKSRLISILSSHSKKQEDIDEAIALLRKYGSVDYAKSAAGRFIKKAKQRLGNLPDTRDKQALLALADYVIQRES